MALNYAGKYSSMVDERFNAGPLTATAVNQNYDWAGVQTVRIFSIPTSPMRNYRSEGDQRYGAPDELGNVIQELQVRRDRSFTFSIDRGNYDNSVMISNASAALSRQLDEVVIPEIDRHRLSAMACGARNYDTSPVSSANAYEAILNADVALSNAKVPPFGRIAFVSPEFYKSIMLDSSFIRQSDYSQNMLVNGAVGLVDNVQIIRVPSGYLPKNCGFIMTHPDAVVAPQKLAEFKIHDNPPGINGWLVEGRVCYDAFVLSQKADALYIHQSDLGELDIDYDAKGNGMFRIVSPGMAGSSLHYKVSSSLPSFEDDLSSWNTMPSDGLINANSGDSIVVASAIDKKAILASMITLS